jgi:hypothetical protein
VWSILLVIFSSCNLWYALAINAIIFTKCYKKQLCKLDEQKFSSSCFFLFFVSEYKSQISYGRLC